MAATRVLVAVSAQSVAAVDDVVKLPQLRVLVMVASRGGLNLGAVTAGLGVHPSNATRAVERLAVAGLLDRRDDPTDRRSLVLELSVHGRGLVERVMDERRTKIAEILARMPPSRRRALVPVLRSFAAAAGEVPASAVWSARVDRAGSGQDAETGPDGDRQIDALPAATDRQSGPLAGVGTAQRTEEVLDAPDVAVGQRDDDVAGSHTSRRGQAVGGDGEHERTGLCGDADSTADLGVIRLGDSPR